jgi:hypothetical protein
VARQLKKRRESILAAAGALTPVALKPPLLNVAAPAMEPADEQWADRAPMVTHFAVVG